MYTAYYKLSRKPFEVRPDVSFYWFGERQRETLSEIQVGVHASKAFQLITGDAGVGKSTLLHTLVAGLDKNVKCTVVEIPHADTLLFFNAIATGFGINNEVTSKVQFLVEFSHFLKQAHERAVKVLLVVDNAHRLDQEMLEEIRMLSNIEKDEVKLLNILLVGRSKFTSLLSLPRNKVVRQRLTFQSDLKPLTLVETRDYITHRLRVAACERKLFTDAAVQLLYEYTGGFPGQINSVCDRLLQEGADRELQEIDVDFVQQSIREPEQEQTRYEQIVADKNPETETVEVDTTEVEQQISYQKEQLTDIAIGGEGKDSENSKEFEHDPDGEPDQASMVSRGIVWGVGALGVLAVCVYLFMSGGSPSSPPDPLQMVAVKSVKGTDKNSGQLKVSQSDSISAAVPESQKRAKIIIPGVSSTNAAGEDLGSLQVKGTQESVESAAMVTEKGATVVGRETEVQGVPAGSGGEITKVAKGKSAKKFHPRIILRKLVIL